MPVPNTEKVRQRVCLYFVLALPSLAVLDATMVGILHPARRNPPALRARIDFDSCSVDFSTWLFSVNKSCDPFKKNTTFLVRPLASTGRSQIIADAKAVFFGTYLCDYWELSVQIYARIDRIHNIHLSNYLGRSTRLQLILRAVRKTLCFFNR